MKKQSYLRWALWFLRIENMCVKPDIAMVIIMLLTLCILHLIEIDGGFVKMWRKLESTWKASDCTRELLALYNLSIGLAGLTRKEIALKYLV